MITGNKFLALCFVIFVVIVAVVSAAITVFEWMCRQADQHAAKNK